MAQSHQDSEGEISRTTTEFPAPLSVSVCLSVSQRRSKKTQFQQIQRGPKIGPKSQNFSLKARIEPCRFFQDTIVLLRTLTLLLKSGTDYKTHPILFFKIPNNNLSPFTMQQPLLLKIYYQKKETEFHHREKLHT